MASGLLTECIWPSWGPAILGILAKTTRPLRLGLRHVLPQSSCQQQVQAVWLLGMQSRAEDMRIVNIQAAGNRASLRDQPDGRVRLFRTPVNGAPASSDLNMGIAGRRGIPSTGMLICMLLEESGFILKKPVLLELTRMIPAAPAVCARYA